MRFLPPGIDLGTTSIRMVQLSEDSEGLHLASYVEARLPVGAMSEAGRVLDRDAVVDALSHAARAMGVRKRFGGSPCVSNMPASLSAVEVVQIKTKDRKRAIRNAEIRASEFAKEPPLDVIDDCSVLAQPVDANRYLVLKSLREGLLERERVLRKAGFLPSIEHEGFAMLRAASDVNGVIDVGRKRTLLVCRDTADFPVCVHFGFGGDAIAERVSRGLTLDVDRARERTHEEGIGIDSSAEWLVDRFVQDFEAALNGMTNDRSIVFREIVACGNGARVPGILERISARTNLPVRLASSYLPAAKNTPIPAAVLQDLGPSLHLAFGLALFSAKRVEERSA